MATHINTTNALKGLTCAIEYFKSVEDIFNADMHHPIQHLTNAATEIDHLNNEVIKLRTEIVRLNSDTNTAVQAQAKRFRNIWDAVIDAIAATDAGSGVLHHGMDIDAATDKAIAVIKKTEAERKEALRTAEAFQKAQPKAESPKDVNAGWSNHHPFHIIGYSRIIRRPGKTTHTSYALISAEIIDEAIRATYIHPKWPTDALHAVSILTEESGELMKAAIEYHYNNGDIEAVREEAIQTGAMALRVLLNIDRYKRPSDEK
ncbi:TPA: hypothetical protein U5D59_000441 [Yersinia enterocolitica]|nr:hypothetical protein [Yersinia enterocolitica]